MEVQWHWPVRTLHKITGSLTLSFNKARQLPSYIKRVHAEVEVEKTTINQECLVNRMLFIEEGLLANNIHSLEMMFFSWQYLQGRNFPRFPRFTPITKIMFSKIVSTLDPITSISSDTRVSLANGNKLEEKAEHIHFKLIANTHILCQLQLFNAKHAYSEHISTETHIVWANHNFFK